MEIKLFEAADKKKSFTFSSLPEKISGSLGTKYQTYDIISQGAVKVPKGTEVAEISWDAVFFGPDRKNLAVVKAESYQKPDKCIKQLREWQEKGTVLNLLVTETWINILHDCQWRYVVGDCFTKTWKWYKVDEDLRCKCFND